jgi:putative membrane protein
MRTLATCITAAIFGVMTLGGAAFAQSDTNRPPEGMPRGQGGIGQGGAGGQLGQGSQGQGQGQGSIGEPRPQGDINSPAPPAANPDQLKVPSGQAQNENISAADREFATNAAQASLAEIKLGQLAADKGSSTVVKTFAKQMVDDHTRANDQLKTITVSKGIMLPTDLTEDQQATYDKLSKLSGKQFDSAYMNEMQKDHDKAVSLFSKEAKSGKDSDLKSFAEKTLPTIKRHDTEAHRDVNQL